MFTTNLKIKSRNEHKNITSSVSVRLILAFCWFYYIKTHDVRDVEAKEVKKALGCYGHKNGCFVYCCSDCGQWVFQSLGCNARICSCCGKRYADSWAVGLSKRMFKVPHRHVVLSVASELWPYLKDNWPLLKVYQDSAIDALNDYLPKSMRDDSIEVGVIVVLHTYGKDMKFQPHLHLIMTEGGFDSRNEFVPKVYLHADGFAECWKYHVCKNFSKAGVPFAVTNWCFRNKRFYVWVHKDGRINHPRVIARYLGRYVRHPVIANSRIDFFNEEKLLVGFHYHDHQDIRHDVVMPVDDFITALIRHIPPEQFKMIRYYGAYARRSKKRFKKHLQSSIEQLKLTLFGIERPKKILKCPYCGGKLEFVWYIKKPPPEIPKIQGELFQYC
ncbi:MAG: transposase [Nanoarchaeota archaeon]|nr:transposase [Nanoarchaeota archaeon]